MSKFLSRLLVEEINYKYNRLLQPLAYYSDYLRQVVIAPAGFINDRESIPLLKGTNTYSGVLHDLLCRKDFRIRVNGQLVEITKWQAAKVYCEAMGVRYADQIAERPDKTLWQKSTKQLGKADRLIRRYGKTGVVIVWPGYWQRLPIMATYAEVVAVNGAP